MNNAAAQVIGQPTCTGIKTRNYKIKSDVVFGIPSQGCQGSGFCHITAARPDRVLAHWKCAHARALVGLRPGGGLRIAFEKRSMTDQQIRKYFRWDIFQVTEAYAIPKSFLIRLGLEAYTVKPGIYTVKTIGQYVVMEC